MSCNRLRFLAKLVSARGASNLIPRHHSDRPSLAALIAAPMSDEMNILELPTALIDRILDSFDRASMPRGLILAACTHRDLRETARAVALRHAYEDEQYDAGVGKGTIEFPSCTRAATTLACCGFGWL